LGVVGSSNIALSFFADLRFVGVCMGFIDRDIEVNGSEEVSESPGDGDFSFDRLDFVFDIPREWVPPLV
jgi:hypothetical protein